MDLQFQKTAIPCLRTVISEVQTQEQTQEVRLSDGMPQIGSVIGAWGQLLLRGKEWRSGSIAVTGGVTAWVLYAPEDGSAPRCLQTWIPFQMKWDLPDTHREGSICVQPLLLGVDARPTSAKKVMVRADMSILAEAMVEDEATVCRSDDSQPDVQLLKRTYPMLLPREAGEKAFLVDEILTQPGNQPAPEKLLRYSAQPVILEQKVLGNKVIFRGTANLHILYMDADEQLHTWDQELPFSQYAQLEGEYDADPEPRIIPTLTALELEKGEDGRYGCKVGITGQYLICAGTRVELIQDAYSNTRKVTANTQTLTLPAVLDTQSELRHPEAKPELDGRVVDAEFSPEHPRFYREGDSVIGELAGRFRLLGYDSAGLLRSAGKRWEETIRIPADGTVKLQGLVSPNGKVSCTRGPEGTALSAELPVTVTGVTTEAMPMVASLELGDPLPPDPQRPSLILQRAGEQTLWELARAAGSTVEAIRKANALEAEPQPKQMLLIPISQ